MEGHFHSIFAVVKFLKKATREKRTQVTGAEGAEDSSKQYLSCMCLYRVEIQNTGVRQADFWTTGRVTLKGKTTDEGGEEFSVSAWSANLQSRPSQPRLEETVKGSEYICTTVWRAIEAVKKTTFFNVPPGPPPLRCPHLRLGQTRAIAQLATLPMSWFLLVCGSGGGGGGGRGAAPTGLSPSTAP